MSIYDTEELQVGDHFVRPQCQAGLILTATNGPEKTFAVLNCRPTIYSGEIPKTKPFWAYSPQIQLDLETIPATLELLYTAPQLATVGEFINLYHEDSGFWYEVTEVGTPHPNLARLTAVLIKRPAYYMGERINY